MKASFPMTAAEVERVIDGLRIDRPRLDRETYTLDQFLDDVIRPTGTIRAVPVHKRRVRYVINGCTAERSEVVADGHGIKTIAIESEDQEAVLTAVESVGLAGRLNTNYRHGLTALLDGVGPRYGVIDVGTNSVKFYLAERDADGRWFTVDDYAVVTRLGEGLKEQGLITPEALERTLSAIEAMVVKARKDDAIAIAIVGTAGMRAAGNSDAFIEALHVRTGLTLEVISGDEEGRLAYLATMSQLAVQDGSLAVFETGGGSTQFSFGHGATIDERFSLDVGAVRTMEVHGLRGAATRAEIDEAEAGIAADLGRIAGRESPDALVGMGGAVTNMAAVMHGLATYDPDIVHGTVLDRSEVERQIELYRSLDLDARRAIVGLQPSRAEVILAGACIVHTIMRMLGHERLTVSDRGLRHQVLVERFGAAALVEDPDR